MSRQKVGYPFKPGHAKMPLKWRPLSFHKRSIMRELWLMSEGGTLATEIQYLVRDMDVHSKADRANVAAGIAKLVKEGFITEDEEGVHLHEHPVGLSTDMPRMSHGLATDMPEVGGMVNPSQAKCPESLPLDLTDQRDQIKEESRERAHTREGSKVERRNPEAAPSFVPARRPLPEPPPEFVERFEPPKPVPAEPTLEDQIITFWKRSVHDQTLRTPGSTRQASAGAAEVATWLRDNVREGETPLGAFQTALKQYMAEDKEALRKASWPLSWLVERLPGYLAAPAQPVRTVTRPEHHVWQEPDWMRAGEAAEARERAAIVAEEVSSDADLDLDLSYIADLGQGFLARLQKGAPEVQMTSLEAVQLLASGGAP